jgi:hypothetical protein
VGQLKDLILAMYPEYTRFVGHNCVLDCRLKITLKGFLQMEGYVRCKVDPCLFHRVLVVYMDNILIVAEQEELKVGSYRDFFLYLWY